MSCMSSENATLDVESHQTLIWINRRNRVRRPQTRVAEMHTNVGSRCLTRSVR
jgi:hypothetical protein